MSDSEFPEFLRRATRRDVLRWGLLAAGGPGALSLIEACGGSTAGQATAPQTDPNATVQIVYGAQQDDSGTIPKQVAAWNAANPKTQVTYQPGPKNSADLHTQFLSSFTAKSPTPDVIDSDVIWPGEFAAAGWIRPLDDLLTPGLKSGLFQSALTAGVYRGKTYAIQRYYDSGQLYYRTDLLQKYGLQVPRTTDELVAAARKIQEGERPGNPNFYGFSWIGAKIEAIFDEFLEWYWSMGGELLDKNGKIAFNNATGRSALQFMYDTVYTTKIAPPGTPTYKTPDIVPLMQNGNVAFMRNWEFAWALVQNPAQSKVVDKVALAPIPSGPGGRQGYGCTGGWCIAINSQSRHPDRAYKFLEYMVSQPAQKEMALGASLSPVRNDVLTDPAVQGGAKGLFKQLPQILKATKARPALNSYTQISAAVQAELSAVITNQKNVADGLKAAQAAVDGIQNG